MLQNPRYVFCELHFSPFQFSLLAERPGTITPNLLYFILNISYQLVQLHRLSLHPHKLFVLLPISNPIHSFSLAGSAAGMGSGDICQSSQSPQLAASSSSSESSFREIEDAFLQTQTRIWLGEVLQIRLDEQLSISEVLADGELLFQVSKVVWRLLLSKHMELRHMIAYQHRPFAPKKNSGRYRPYSNVDSFLKICKILELTGIDLFSPSDVVEKRNTRRVCMCIRSFSKKARSKNINVPDFDIVTYTITMPKDMVGCIRRNLELSQSSLSDSPSYYVQKHAGGKFRQGYSVTASTGNHETYLEGSDHTEPSHPILQSHGLCTDFLYDYTSGINSNLEDTQVTPMVKSIFLSKDLDQLDIQSQQRIGTSENESELLCSMESLHPCSENIEHDGKFTWSSSPSSGNSHIDFSAMASHLDTTVKYVQESGIMDFNYSESGKNATVFGNPMNERTPAGRDALEKKATSNLTGHAKDSRDPVLFYEENSTSNVHQSASSHGSNSTPRNIENGRYFKIGDNMEVLRVAGMSSWSMEALNLGDKFDEQNSFQNFESFDLHDDNMDLWNDIMEGYEFQGKVKYREMAHDITSGATYSHSTEKFGEHEHSLYSPGNCVSKTNLEGTNECLELEYEDSNSQNDLKVLDHAGFYQSVDFQSYLLCEFCKWDQKGKCAVISANGHGSFSSYFPKVGSHEERTQYIRHKTSDVFSPKVMSSVPKDEEEAVVNLDIDDKQLKNDCHAVLSNVVGVEYHDKCPNIGDEVNDFRDKDVITPSVDKRVLDMVTDDVPSSYHNVVVPCSGDDDVSHTPSCLTNGCSKLECKYGHKKCQYYMDRACHLEYTSQKEMKPEDESPPSVDNPVETEGVSIEIPKGKSQNMLLIKSVLGGTAAFGMLFMVMHLRRNGRGKVPASSKASSNTFKVQKKSSQNIHSNRRGIYSAEKLKLGGD